MNDFARDSHGFDAHGTHEFIKSKKFRNNNSNVNLTKRLQNLYPDLISVDPYSTDETSSKRVLHSRAHESILANRGNDRKAI